AFVTKLNPTGSTLVYSTYLGGSSLDSGDAIAIDSSGNAYIGGMTISNDFPVTQGAFQPAYGGRGTYGWGDGFVAKLNANASSLVYSSYLGGSDGESLLGIAVDGSGNGYVTG